MESVDCVSWGFRPGAEAANHVFMTSGGPPNGCPCAVPPLNRRAEPAAPGRRRGARTLAASGEPEPDHSRLRLPRHTAEPPRRREWYVCHEVGSLASSERPQHAAGAIRASVAT